MSKLYLGVDGGGSKTELCVADGEGKVLLTLSGGATSFKSVGNAAAFANMRDLVRRMENFGIRASHVTRSSGACPAVTPRRTGWFMRP